MKRTIFLIIISLFISSFKSDKEKLELNLDIGETYYQNIQSNTNINQVYNGQEINIDLSTFGKTSFKVIDIINSIYSMEVSYLSLGLSMNIQNKLIEFNSEKENEEDILSMLLTKMKEKSFNIKMTKTGKVIEVKNIDSLFLNLFDDLPNTSEIQKKQFIEQLSKSFGEKALIGSIEMCTLIFKDMPVSKGEKWEIITNLESVMSAEIKTTFLYKKKEENYIELSGIGKIKTINKGTYFDLNGIKVKYDLKGTINSVIKIDKKTGWIMDSKINQVISGNTTMIENSGKATLIVPMTIKNSYTVKDK